MATTLESLQAQVDMLTAELKTKADVTKTAELQTKLDAANTRITQLESQVAMKADLPKVYALDARVTQLEAKVK